MLSLFSSLTPYFNKKKAVPNPDNFVFKLHYRVTYVILMICVLLNSSYHYIDSSGSAIQCIIDSALANNNDLMNMINRYCWISSTYTLPQHFTGVSGEEFLFHGVGVHEYGDEKIFHAYYQWIPLCLAFQAISFYVPHWIWKLMEGGRMKNILLGLQLAIDDDDNRDKVVHQLADYMIFRRDETREHQIWAFKYIFCEILNLLNVIFQMILTNTFLGGEFTTYGLDVLNFPYDEPENRVDPLSRVFPKMTKCMFRKYGSSGTIQNFDALCVLGMNIMNEKIYIFLWFWFVSLLFVSSVNIAIRISQFLSPKFRSKMGRFSIQFYHFDLIDENSNVVAVLSKASFADWMILSYLSKAMNSLNFKSLIDILAEDGLASTIESDDETFDPESKSLSRQNTLKSKSKLTEWIPFKIVKK